MVSEWCYFSRHFQTNPQVRREDLCSRGALSSPYRAQVACSIRDSVSIDCWKVDINFCGWKQRMLYAQLEITMISSQIISCGCSSLAVWSFGLSRPQQSCWKCGAYLKIQGSCVSLAGKCKMRLATTTIFKHMLDPISTQRLNRFWSNVGFIFSNKCCWTHFLCCSTDGFVHSVPWEVLNHSQFPKTLVG